MIEEKAEEEETTNNVVTNKDVTEAFSSIVEGDLSDEDIRI